MQDGQHVRGAGAQQSVILAAQQGLVHGIEPVLAGMAHHFGMEHALRQQDGRAQAAVRGGARVAFAPGPALAGTAQQARQVAHDAVGKVHQCRGPGIGARPGQHEPGIHLRHGQKMRGAGSGPVFQRGPAFLLQHLQAHTGQARTAHHEQAVPGHGAAPHEEIPARIGLAPDGDAHMQEGAAGQISARQGQALFLRQSGHAGEKAVEPQRIHVIGQAQGQGEGQRTAAAGRDVAHIDGQGLVADLLGREIGPPEVDILQKKVAAHAQGRAGLEHGAVVAPAQQQGRVRGREMPGQAGKDAVLGSARRLRHISPPVADSRPG